MRLKDLFPPSALLVGFQARDKWDAIDRLFDHLVGAGRISERQRPALRDAVVARERSMATGMERGIAIPHAAVEGIDGVVACLAIAPAGRGLDFGSIDASPSQLVILLLIPRAQKLLHIRTLADIARVLSNDEVRKALIAAHDATAAAQTLERV
jgi:mannitol/fructose-specific phosphotransferase system IIA component (Ntr-type)